MTFTDFILTLILLALICDIAVTILKRVPQTDLATLDALFFMTHEYMAHINEYEHCSFESTKSRPTIAEATRILKQFNHRGYK